jgi:biotin operon repressor
VNFLQVPDHVWRHSAKLSGLQFAILCDAWTWEAQGKPARRSNDQLAEMFGATSRAVTKSVKRLEELGLVRISYAPNHIRLIHPEQSFTLNERSPRTIVHPEQSFTPPLNDCSPLPRTIVHPSPEQSFTLVENIEENKEEKKVEKRASQPKIEIVMPWESEAFADAWREWKAYKKAEHGFKFKSPNTEQTALHKLYQDAEGNEQLAIYAIATSISNGWKGTFINAKLKREFDGINPQAANGGWSEAELRHWARTGEMPNPYSGAV